MNLSTFADTEMQKPFRFLVINQLSLGCVGSFSRKPKGLFYCPKFLMIDCAWEGLRGNRLKDLDRRTKREQKARGKLQAVNGEGVKPDRHGLIEKNGTVPANPGQVRIKPLEGLLSGLSAMIGGDARTPPRHRLWVLKSGKRVQAYTGYTPHEATGSSYCGMVIAFQTCFRWALGCFAQSLTV